MDRATHRNGQSRIVALAAVAAVIAALYLAREILIPVALATLLSFLLSPLVDILERLRLGRVAATLTATAIALLPVALIGWVAGMELVDLARSLPQYRANIQQKLDAFQAPAGGLVDRAIEAVREMGLRREPLVPAETATGEVPIPVTIVEPPSAPLELLRSFVGPLLHPIGVLGIVLVFTAFILIQREDLRDRLIRLISQGRLTATTQALAEVGDRIGRYLRTQLLINVGNGAVTALGLLLIGVPSALLWGALSVALRFIPYAGPVLSASMPVALSLAVSDSWTMPLLTIGLFLTVELISNNAIEPWAYGSSTGISSAALLVAVIFWTWLWGIPGLLLATPLTVCVAVAGRYVPQLEFLNVILGTEPVLPPQARLYQRLLAGDSDEALEIAGEYLAEHSLAQTYDDLLICALRSADEDFESRALNERRRQLVQAATNELVDELAALTDRAEARREVAVREARGETDADQPPAPPPGGEVTVVVERVPTITPAPPRIRVVVVPARDEADAIAGRMLGRLLADAGINTETLSLDDLGTDLAETIGSVAPSVLVVSSVPPFAATQARLRVRQLSMKSPGIPQLVGLWSVERDVVTRSRQRMLEAGARGAVTSLAEAVEEVAALLRSAEQPRPPQTPAPTSTPPAPPSQTPTS